MITDSVTELTVLAHAKTLSRKIFKKADRQNVNIVFIRVDIDNFKQINDSKGHEAGNAALKLLADCARESIRHGTDHIFTRPGGDEQLYILYDIDSHSEANKIIKRISRNFDIALLKNRIRNINGHRIGISTGYAIRYPNDTRNFEDIDYMADRVCMDQKRRKKKNITL